MEKLNIKTKRLHIRNLKLSDLNDFHIYRSNPEIAKFQGFDVMDLEAAERFIRDQLDKQFGNPGEWVQYGIENISSGKIIGDCAIKLDQYDPRIAEIGVTISHLEQQKGYAKEVMLGILSFLFDVKKLHRVVETSDAENTASIRLLESMNFRKEGHFIDNIFFKGKWGSEVQYAMLKREWDERKDL
jgi:ribosomal-protein-alanine N-acetyltransferase